MALTLTIFSGLPGTGKSTLAHSIATQLKQPLFAIDDIYDFIPEVMREKADPFWETLIGIMLNLVEVQLSIGVSVVVDSVFMGDDRAIAEQLAHKYQVRYRPIHTYLSDEAIWEKRVEERRQQIPEAASWARIQTQRLSFAPWVPGTALFVDSVQPFEDNLEKVLQFIQKQE